MCEICHGIVGHLARCPENNAAPKIVAYCECCGEPIEEMDEVWKYQGVMYHPECFEEIAVDLLEKEGAKKCEAKEE